MSLGRLRGLHKKAYNILKQFASPEVLTLTKYQYCSTVLCVLNCVASCMHAWHMHMNFIASHRLLIDTHFPNMKTIAGSNLYFDGTWVYTVVARSFTTFGGSHAPEHTVVSRVSANSRVSTQVAVLPSRMESAHSRVSAQARCA